MKALLPVACSFLLTAYGVNAFAQGEEAPALPDRYAEVVLRVEGMI
jgi:hypothetical protein